MKKMIIVLFVCFGLMWSGLADSNTNLFQAIRQELALIKEQAGEIYPEEGHEELLMFEHGVFKKPYYEAFAQLVTNDWRYVVTNINQITTNYIERLLIFGTGKKGDEALYLAYLEVLAQMRINNEITSLDFAKYKISSIEIFHTVLWRRYQEPAVSNLIETLKVVYPDTNYWDMVTSGEQYRMHLEMYTPRCQQ